jgi:hypothetical protein
MAGGNQLTAGADDPSLARLGAFSDGVFAFAITLLVLTIRIPHPSDADSYRHPGRLDRESSEPGGRRGFLRRCLDDRRVSLQHYLVVRGLRR